MGGTFERMHVYGADLDFANFHAEKAECYVAADKDRLLAVVEAGFGTLAAFTSAVRALSVEGVEQQALLNLEPAPASVVSTGDLTSSMVWTSPMYKV